MRVSDLTRSRPFCEDILGLHVDQDFPGEKLRLRLGKGAEAPRLVLKPPVPGSEGGEYSRGAAGSDNVALSVAARSVLEAVETRLAAVGLSAPGIRVTEDGGTFLACRDPGGIVVELFVDD